MVRYPPRQSRALNLWTAAWLFALLLALLLRVGDITVQWPALLVPVIWALVALRRGRGERRVTRPRDDPPYVPPYDPPEDPPDLPDRRPPPTREMPGLPGLPRDRREE